MRSEVDALGFKPKREGEHGAAARTLAPKGPFGPEEEHYERSDHWRNRGGRHQDGVRQPFRL